MLDRIGQPTDVLGDAQLGEQRRLPGRGAAAVAAHRGDHERLEPERAHRCCGRADDPADLQRSRGCRP